MKLYIQFFHFKTIRFEKSFKNQQRENILNFEKKVILQLVRLVKK